MKMVEPMKKWTVYYDGEMILQSTNERVKVKLQVNIISNSSKFHQMSKKTPYVTKAYKLYTNKFSTSRESIPVSYRISTLIQIWILGQLHVHLLKKRGQKSILIELKGKSYFINNNFATNFLNDIITL
jgi:hypothetical protein